MLSHIRLIDNKVICEFPKCKRNHLKKLENITLKKKKKTLHYDANYRIQVKLKLNSIKLKNHKYYWIVSGNRLNKFL